MFVDETIIEVSSGNGGAGCVSFRREKYVPKGGPDGGDGGTGGDVIFIVRENLKTLARVKQKRTFHAGNGQPGMGRRKFGKDGKNVEIAVPPGTLIRESAGGRILKDMTGVDEWVFLHGGKGGKGNANFATSRKQAPRYAQPGLPGESATLLLELNLIADLGFVGFPNAGKSTLLSVLTNANPQIAAYAFTTKIPNLGVMQVFNQDIILADIPGLLEGASKGVGLGIKFLKHIARTRGLVFLVDISSGSGLAAVRTLREELGQYSEDLLEKPYLIAATKKDAWENDDGLKELQDAFNEVPVFAVSAVTRDGLGDLKTALHGLAIRK